MTTAGVRRPIERVGFIGLGTMGRPMARNLVSFTPGFMVDLAHEDGIALQLGAATRVPLAVGAAARELFTAARARERGRLDWTAVVAVLEELAGVEVRPARPGPAER